MIPADLLVHAYATGWFPMGVEEVGEPVVEWFSPNPRGILPLDTFNVPSRLERTIRRGRFRVQIDTCFERVMRECAARDETWITQDIVESYVNLHKLGFAHSVEAWQDDQLAGGLYGVALRGGFFGESMFHHVTDASKVALRALVDRLRERGYALLDVQWVTPHLATFGAIDVSRRRYLKMLEHALTLDCRFV